MQRRDLRFSKLSEIQADVRELVSKGYSKTGQWDLSQMCEHLADWMSFPMVGYPKSPWFIRVLLGIMRVTQGKSLYQKFSKQQRMATGQPTIPETVYAAGADSFKAVSRLIDSVDQLASYRGTLHPSPLFGELNYDEVVALQLAHCAHHLSFLVPERS
jgi:hypothetical protein